MSAMQRRKGASGERELAGLLRERLGLEMTRNLDQCRVGGANLLGLTGWSVEIKRAARSRITAWWDQCCAQAATDGKRPVLFYHLDRQPWRAVLALKHVATGFPDAPLSLRLETDLNAFAAWMRKNMTIHSIN